MLQKPIHNTLRLLVPGVIAFVFFRKVWKKAWLIMFAAMLIGADQWREFK
ncbi:DUF6122 family protein [Aequorivita sp. Q41]